MGEFLSGNISVNIKDQKIKQVDRLAECLDRMRLDTNTATVACLRLDDNIRWCYEHLAPVGARADMLRIRSEPVPGLLVAQRITRPRTAATIRAGATARKGAT